VTVDVKYYIERLDLPNSVILLYRLHEKISHDVLKSDFSGLAAKKTFIEEKNSGLWFVIGSNLKKIQT